MQIRDATTADAATISDLVCSLTREAIAPTLGEGGIGRLLAGMDAESTTQRILDGWTHIVVIIDGCVVGVIVVRPPSHLYHLFVRAELQGAGIARQLFASADRRTRDTIGLPIATVNSALNTVAVYERLGFKVAGPVVDADGVRFQPMVRADGEKQVM